ncbi:NADPH2:quinone reductase [Agromyces albus]|nr:zinc-binding dehydrogenase [Agromyces albus]MDQ0577229.1 NADPH2:quinone reductase [Agromyces albus]
MDVKAISLNRGEMRMLKSAPEGMVPGWDFAGIVRDDHKHLKAGTRVAGIVESSSWAEEVVVRADWLAPIPDAVSFTDAAALPTAGLTALRTLRMSGAGLGDDVLVTGAAGGVGRFAVQLAARSGARVTALVTRGGDLGKILTGLGASSVVTKLEELYGPYDAIIESVGGDVLGRALTMLDPRGTLVTFGNSADQPTTFDVRDVYNAALVRILGFELFFDPLPFGRDIGRLLALVEHGELDPHVVDVMSWTRMADALERLGHRSLGGKLVLTVD